MHVSRSKRPYRIVLSTADKAMMFPLVVLCLSSFIKGYPIYKKVISQKLSFIPQRLRRWQTFRFVHWIPATDENHQRHGEVSETNCNGETL